MVGGAVVSLIVFAIGAILDFAVTTSTYQHGFNINTVGVILMIVGAIGFVISLAAWTFMDSGWRRHRTMIDDGRGHVMRREDSFT
jgi:hypothetical protein